MEYKIFNNFRMAAGLASIAFTVLCLLASFFLMNIIFGWFEDTTPYANQINLQGRGEVFAVPDVATFNYTIKENAETIAEAQQSSNEKNDQVMAILKEAEIDEKDIKTTSYNIYPKYEWQRGNCTNDFCQPSENVLIGQEVSQTVSVKVRDTEKAADLLAQIGQVEVANVSNLSFLVDDTDVLKSEARRIAIEDAKEKANELENLLGIKLGKVVGFHETDRNYYPEPMMKAEGMGGAYDSMSSDINLPQGENKITSNVNLSFEIKK